MTSPSTGKRKGGLLNFLLLGVGLAFLGWTLYSNRAVLAEVLSRPIRWGNFVAAFVFMAAAALITYFRWYALVRMLGVPFRLIDSLRLSFVGAFFNLVIPGAVGGDLVKAAYLARMDLPRTQAITTLLIDRAVGLVGLFYLASIAALAGWSGLPQTVRNLGIFAMAMAAAGSVALVAIMLDLPNRLLPGLSKSHGKLGHLARELGALSKSYRSHWKGVVATVAVSALCHGLACVACYQVGVALFPNFSVGLDKHLMIFPLVLFSTAVPLPFGALGLSEKLSDELFSFVGHPSGGVAMMGYRVLTYAFTLISLVIYLWNLSAIRDLTKQAEAMQAELAED